MGEWNEYVKQRYDEGMRACLLHGDVHVYTYQNVDKYFPVINPDLWMDLRAYQDEQRKKGEPILVEHLPKNWFYSTYRTNKDTEFIFGWNSKNWIPNNPRVQVHYRYYFGGIDPVGQFTNFRWRPGHGPTKEDGTCMHCTCDPEEGPYPCMAKKGGSNG